MLAVPPDEGNLLTVIRSEDELVYLVARPVNCPLTVRGATARAECSGWTSTVHWARRSLQAAARTRPALKRMGRNREREHGTFSNEGFVMRASVLTPRNEDTGDPWTGCRLERSLTVLFSFPA